MAEKYRIFDITLKEKRRLSPTMMRCIFWGPEVNRMKLVAPDQRVKFLFPKEKSTTHRLKNSKDWYQHYISIPVVQRPAMRTYTLRTLRTTQNEMEVEFVLHGVNGPASTWVTQAVPGEDIQVIAPNADFAGDSGGYEWILPSQTKQVLLIADETALPATKSILEELFLMVDPPHVQALFEVPLAEDCIAIPSYWFAEVYWLPRGHQHLRGSLLMDTVRHKVKIPASARIPAQSLKENSLGGDLLWERAENASTFFAWVAANGASVKQLRHYLIRQCELDRASVNFMAYWC